MNSLVELLTNNKVKGIIAIAAAVVMYFTPDEIDKIIEGLLGAFGISQFIIHQKEKGE